MKKNLLAALLFLLAFSTPMLYAYLMTVAPEWMISSYFWQREMPENNEIQLSGFYKYSFCLGVFSFALSILNFFIIHEIMNPCNEIMTPDEVVQEDEEISKDLKE